MREHFNIFVIYGLFALQFICTVANPTGCPDIVTRKQWGAREPEFIAYTVFPLEYVIIHHTVTSLCTTQDSCSSIIKNIQNFHMEKPNKFGDIGYNFLIGGDGKVYEGIGWHKQGAHTYGYNKKSIGIGFIGNFANETPPSKQLEVAKALLECGVKLGELSENYKLYGAKQVRPSESPGAKLFSKIKKWQHFAEPGK